MLTNEPVRHRDERHNIPSLIGAFRRKSYDEQQMELACLFDLVIHRNELKEFWGQERARLESENAKLREENRLRERLTSCVGNSAYHIGEYTIHRALRDSENDVWHVRNRHDGRFFPGTFATPIDALRAIEQRETQTKEKA